MCRYHSVRRVSRTSVLRKCVFAVSWISSIDDGWTTQNPADTMNKCHGYSRLLVVVSCVVASPIILEMKSATLFVLV